MKIVTLMIISFLILSCDSISTQNELDHEKPSILDEMKSIHSDSIEVVEIDECEYLIIELSPHGNQGFGFMAHKGNCKNSFHTVSNSKSSLED